MMLLNEPMVYDEQRQQPPSFDSRSRTLGCALILQVILRSGSRGTG
jgi:hypothetical protein